MNGACYPYICRLCGNEEAGLAGGAGAEAALRFGLCMKCAEEIRRCAPELREMMQKRNQNKVDSKAQK